MGQGAAEAGLFAEHGARVAVTDVADTADVTAELGDQAVGLSLDVTEEAQWASAVAATVEKFGGLQPPHLAGSQSVQIIERPAGPEEVPGVEHDRQVDRSGRPHNGQCRGQVGD